VSLSISVVLLTMGNRPAELERAVRSALEQEGDEVEVFVLGNGGDVPPLPAQVRTARVASNLGIPGGRNRGIRETSGDIVVFLDDDGWYPSRGLAEHLREIFSADPTLGIVSFRIVDPESGAGARRHVPRLRAGDPERSSEVTTFLGGACAVRRAVFDQVGLFWEGFWYAHEETDLAWRAMDHGWRIGYDAESVMWHPVRPADLHDQFHRLNARNRVWLARRNLPWPVGVWYLLDWVLLTVLRTRPFGGLRPWFAGFVEGWRTPCGPRRPIRWRTVWRMTRAGRPPIV
jgi:GT2 family glycosyltransferase